MIIIITAIEEDILYKKRKIHLPRELDTFSKKVSHSSVWDMKMLMHKYICMCHGWPCKP
jgi:hypothetical protein